MMNKIKSLFYILLGNAMVAFAVCAFVTPNGFLLGGTTGISLTIQTFLPLRLSVISAVVYAALFALGWIFMGWKFAATSLLSTILSPLFIAIFEILPVGTLFQEDKLTCAIFCGILIGVGIGLVVRTGGSTGGMDIPPCILQKYKGIPVSKSLAVFDGLVVLMQVFFRGLDGILYSLIVIALTSFMVDKTIIMGDQKVQIIIISPEYQNIRKAILSNMDCGVTMLDIETGYQGLQQKAILSVVYSKKYPAIRSAALAIDPKAFIVASDVNNVNGKGYTLNR